MKYFSLGQLVLAIESGELIDGDKLTNADTGEQVVVKDKGLYFVTFNGYISNEVPLVASMVNSDWELEDRTYSLQKVDLAQALEALLDNVAVYNYDNKTMEVMENLDDFITVMLEYAGDCELLEDFLRGDFYLKEPLKKPSKFSRKTSETEAWGMLMDKHLFGKSAQEIADKYDISVRNVYYVLDGTHYPKVKERFMTMLEKGELNFERN